MEINNGKYTIKRKKIQNTETEPAFLSRITNTFVQFRKLNLDGRKRILHILNREKLNEKDSELKSFIIEVESIFFGKHLKLTVDSIRRQYQITGKPTKKDFYRICEGENITVVNSLSEPAAKKIKAVCVFKSGDLEGEFFLNFDESLKGRELLRCQFHLLGNYFLHRNELPPAAKQELLAPEIISTKQEEAALFAIQFLDMKQTEEQND